VDIAAYALVAHSPSQSRKFSPVCSLMNIILVDAAEKYLSLKKKYERRWTSWVRSRNGKTLFRT